MHNNRNNHETVIIPQIVNVPTKIIIVASLVVAMSFLRTLFFRIYAQLGFSIQRLNFLCDVPKSA